MDDSMATAELVGAKDKLLPTRSKRDVIPATAW